MKTAHSSKLLRIPLRLLRAARIEKGPWTMAEGNGTTFAADIMEIGDKIAGLTVTKAVQLRDYLKEKYKLEPAAGGAVVMAAGGGGGGGAAAAEKPAEKTEFTVTLEGLADPA